MRAPGLATRALTALGLWLSGRIRGSTEAKLTFLRPSATSRSADLACPRLPPVHRVRPHPAPHTDLPGLPRSHLHLPSAFTVWPDGQCEAGLALELSQAGDGAVLSPQPCPRLTVRFSPGLGLHWLLRHNQHTVTWRQHFPVYTATQPESHSTAGWGLGPCCGDRVDVSPSSPSGGPTTRSTAAEDPAATALDPPPCWHSGQLPRSPYTILEHSGGVRPVSCSGSPSCPLLPLHVRLPSCFPQ